MTRRPYTGGPSLAGRLATGLGALAVLAGITVGLPMLLRYAAAVMLPHGWTPLSEIPGALLSPDDGSLLAQAVIAAGWGTWAVFAILVAWEVARRLLGRQQPAKLRTPTGFAGFLVAAVAALATSPVSSAQAASIAVVATDTDQRPDDDHTPPGSAAQPSHVTHLVDRGQGLLDVAEMYGLPWQQIAEANYGRVQPDGGMLEPGRSMIYPGWQLRIPTTPAPATTLVAATEADSPTVCAGEHILNIDGDRYAYFVQRDDTLWHIAELCLGDGAEWPQIWELNQGRHFPQVGGTLNSPGLIYPGWDLHLPADAVPPQEATPIDPDQPEPPAESEPEPEPVPASPATPPPDHSPEPTPGTPTPGTPAPAPATPTPAPMPTPTPDAGAEPTPAPPGGEPAGEPDPDDRSLTDTVLPVTAALATAGLLSALVLARLRHNRARRQQHRRHGSRLVEPDPKVETVTRVAAQPAEVTRLDHALRALAASLHGVELERLPDIVAAWLDGGTVHLLLATPCPDPPPPYVAGAGDMSWTLPAEAAVPAPQGHLAPLPTLATIASHPDGQHLLVDVERAGLLTVTGDPARRADLLRYLAAEAATAEWVDDGEVIVVGFSSEETAQLIALNEERVRATASVDEAVARVQRRAAANQAALVDAGCGNAFAGRINDIAADAWMPHLLIIADPEADLTGLDHTLHNAPRSAVAVAAAANQPGSWNIHIDHSGRVDVDWLSVTEAYAAALPADQLARLAPMLRTARSLLPPDDADFDEPVPAAPEDEPWAQGTDMHGHLLEPAQEDDLFSDDALARLGSPASAADEAIAGAEQMLDPAEPQVVDAELWPEVSQPPAPPAAPPDSTDPSAPPDDLPREPPVADPAERSPAVSFQHADDHTGRTDQATGPVEPAGTIHRLLPTFAAPAGEAAQPAAAVAPAPNRRTRPAGDPDLDADLADWHAPTLEHGRPRIGVLGPVVVGALGRPPADRQRFYAELVVYLAQRGRRGAVPDELDEAIWPSGITFSSRRVAMSKIRTWLGETPDGELWLPTSLGGDRAYRIRDGYLFDWHLFRRLRTRGEARGAAGTSDLRRALELVRGVPLDGADRPYHLGKRNPYAWLPNSTIPPHHLASAIVDTAHQLVGLCLAAGDTETAQWAVEQAWLADPDKTDDHPWIDLMRIYHADGHTSELRTLLEQLMDARGVEVPEELNPRTFQAIDALSGDLLNLAGQQANAS